jgi:hypothetical protein
MTTQETKLFCNKLKLPSGVKASIWGHALADWWNTTTKPHNMVSVLGRINFEKDGVVINETIVQKHVIFRTECAAKKHRITYTEAATIIANELRAEIPASEVVEAAKAALAIRSMPKWLTKVQAH